MGEKADVVSPKQPPLVRLSGGAKGSSPGLPMNRYLIIHIQFKSKLDDTSKSNIAGWVPSRHLEIWAWVPQRLLKRRSLCPTSMWQGWREIQMNQRLGWKRKEVLALASRGKSKTIGKTKRTRRRGQNWFRQWVQFSVRWEVQKWWCLEQ